MRRARFTSSAGVALALLSTSTLGHDLRPIFVDVTEETAPAVTVRWKVPGSVERDALPEVSLAGECEAHGDIETLRYPQDYQLTRDYQCPNGVSEHEVILDFPVPNPSLTTIVRVGQRNGVVHNGLLAPGDYTWGIPAEPDRLAVAANYTALGIEHIWEGWDHLLFVVCLVLVARTVRRVLITITGFTIAHSITLALSTLDLVALPIGPVEAVIALSIVFVAMEIARNRKTGLTYRYPALVATSFGFLHGFGFASVLRQVGLPQTELPTALLFFNVGVEIGQILFVIVLFALGHALTYLRGHVQWPVSRLAGAHPEMWAAYAIGTLASFWTVERVVGLWV